MMSEDWKKPQQMFKIVWTEALTKTELEILAEEWGEYFDVHPLLPEDESPYAGFPKFDGDETHVELVNKFFGTDFRGEEE